MDNLQNLIEAFNKQYGRGSKPSLFFAPGRVNLIGEHTDYNQGYVLPMAIHLGTYLLVRPNTDSLYRFASLNMDQTAEIPINADLSKEAKDWVRYPAGIIDVLNKRGHKFPGLDFLFYGDLPHGAGLSSSASIEIVAAYALKTLFNLNISKVELTKIARECENDFIGLNCGIMDMFAIALGKQGHALFLNCGTLNYAYVPVHADDFVFVVADTRKERKLSDSKYNERVMECKTALESMPLYEHKTSLSHLGIEEFDKLSHHIKDDKVRSRARHVISENERVFSAVKALNNKNILDFGNLMKASHQSLRDDYEVTGMELDALVADALEIPGVIGARMTGAGFGGCTINLVERNSLPEFKEKLAVSYKNKTGLEAAFYEVRPSSGPVQLA